MSQLENTPGKPEFKQLWPTQFMSLSLPGHDTANPVLADHLLEQNIARDDMTVDYTSNNLFMTDHPAVIWLRQCCEESPQPTTRTPCVGSRPLCGTMRSCCSH